ncbi:MAG: thermonuclease family protein [Prolixibacteraceae bacterium]
MYQYSALVRKVIDGDTLEIDIDLGLSTWIHNERIRLFGVNTPEVYGVKKGSPEWDEGNKASEFAKSVLKENNEIRIETIKDKKEKYGRYLALVYVRMNESLLEGLPEVRKLGEFYCYNDIIIAKGLAVTYMI